MKEINRKEKNENGIRYEETEAMKKEMII